jgi:hypothetical protein
MMLKDYRDRYFKLGDMVVRATAHGFVLLKVVRVESWLDSDDQPRQRVRLDSGGRIQNPRKYMVIS